MDIVVWIVIGIGVPSALALSYVLLAIYIDTHAPGTGGRFLIFPVWLVLRIRHALRKLKSSVPSGEDS